MDKAVDSRIPRRTIFRSAAAGLLGGALASPAQQSANKRMAFADILPGAGTGRKLKVVYVGAHVDDWGSCAGTLARYAHDGHSVLCLSFTPGDSASMAVAAHMPLERLAAIRREDAVKGTSIIGAQFKVLNQHNQQMHTGPEVYDQFNAILAAEKPDVVFGMWPLEFHPDHRAAGMIAYNAWLASGMKFAFYLSETLEAAEMSVQQFAPNRWVDIEPVMELKRESVVANRFLKSWWPECETWAKFRGGEYGCRFAESFVRIVTVATVDPKNIAPHRWYGGAVRITHD